MWSHHHNCKLIESVLVLCTFERVHMLLTTMKGSSSPCLSLVECYALIWLKHDDTPSLVHLPKRSVLLGRRQRWAKHLLVFLLCSQETKEVYFIA
jgi:hypothetical protein